MELTIYQVDAFATAPFEGNPAAVCPLTNWLDGALMQRIAMENNLSETAFFVPTDSGYHIRWFTPAHEVDLCGHATLASAHVLFNHLGYEAQQIAFESRSGILRVRQSGDGLEMDFPAQPPKSCPTPEAIVDAFADTPVECLAAQDYIVVFADEASVMRAQPNMTQLKRLDLRGVAITAKSTQYDFVTRFFAPKYGIDEDPVTGSAFTQLAPYWARRLNKLKMTAKQVSQRGGTVVCKSTPDRVLISGNAATYLIGRIALKM
ncbi:MAG: PhzF family phenazine biosynthesis protein [Candidatus Thiodiazotropha sp.]